MARPAEERLALRAAYLSGLPMETAATRCVVPLPTARRWKKDAKTEGDDWDKLRAAQLLAGGDIEDVLRRLLSQGVRQVEATMNAMMADQNMPPAAQVDACAALADMLVKLTAAVRRLSPETDVLAVRLGTVKQFAEFVRTRYPASAPALLEALQAFGEVVARG
jgi:hypothetical protein